jgi:DNA/RNA endonuclease G (NUC1)
VSEFSECNTQISGNAINLNRECAGNGSFINIGFQLSDGKGFVNLIDVCYSKKKGSSIYTRHVVQGKAIKNAMKSSTRPSTFKTAEVPSNIEASKSFTKANQLKRFEQIFNDREKAQEFLNKTYLARGHLSPDGDFLFVSWQFATYYYINTVPQVGP